MNPFDNPDAQFRVLTNDQGQHSLWPSFATVPAGWHVVFGKDNRAACIRYITSNWRDLRPRGG